MSERMTYTERLNVANRTTWLIRTKAEIIKLKAGSALVNALDESNSTSVERHQTACAVICGLLDDKDLPLLEKHKDARDLLNALDERYKGLMEHHVTRLWRDFNAFKMQPNQSLRDYIKRIKDIVEELTACKQPVADANAVLIALKGLPSRYDPYVAPYYSTTLMPKTLDELENNLLGVETVIDERASTSVLPNTLFAGKGDQDRGNERGGGNSRGGGYRRGNKYGGGNGIRCFQLQGNRSLRQGMPKPKKECAKCHLLGHTAEECRNRRRRGGDGGAGNDGGYAAAVVERPLFMLELGDSPSRTVAAEMLELESTPAFTVSPSAASGSTETSGPQLRELDATWYLDSGAIYHVTPDARSLRDYKPCDPIPLKCGGGEVHYAVGYGDLLVEVVKEQTDCYSFHIGNNYYHKQKGPVVIKIRNVYYVPGFKFRLLSLKQLTNNGAQFSGSGTSMDVWNSRERWSLYAHCKYSVYSVKVKEKLPRMQSGGPVASVHLVADRARLWHSRFGHLSYGNLARLADEEMVAGLDVTPKKFREVGAAVCEGCVMGKHSRKPFPESHSSVGRALERVHMDLAGPMSVESYGGNSYVATFLDEYTGLSVVSFLKLKSEAIAVVKSVLTLLENQCGQKVKEVRTDRGREYLNAELREFYGERGIVHQTSAPYTPQQNGIAERLNRTLMEKVRCMLIESGLPSRGWALAMHTANYLRNRSPVHGLKGTPFERFYGQKPDVSDLRVFGCVAYIRVPDHQRRKIDPVSMKGVFVGYEPESKAYRVLMPDGRQLVSREVKFDERAFGLMSVKGLQYRVEVVRDEDEESETGWMQEGEEESEDSSDVQSSISFDVFEGSATVGANDSSGAEPASTSGGPVTVGANDSSGAEPASASGGVGTVGANDSSGAGSASASGGVGSVGGNNSSSTLSAEGGNEQPRNPPQLRTSTRSNKGVPPVKLNLSAVNGVPLTYEEAMKSPEAPMWKQAMDEELASIRANEVWRLEIPPKSVRPLPVKWVFSLKKDEHGEIVRYKARLVAKGFAQVEGRDYEEVWAPVSKHTTLRALLSVAARDLELHQLDVKTAFLNGELEETVYIQQPPGYVEGEPYLACKLEKALYGLKQAPRAWYARLRSELEAMNFTVSQADPGLFYRDVLGERVYLLVYVDDLLIAAKDINIVRQLKDKLKSILMCVTWVRPVCFLGFEIERNRAERTMKVSQKRYAKGLVEKYGLEDANGRAVPLSHGTTLHSAGQPLDVRQFRFGELIGSLLYLSVGTRPDIAYSVGALARHMSKPTVEHWQAAKGVVRYIAGTAGLGIVFSPKSSNPSLHGYCDSDYAACVDTRRSTTGYVFLNAGGAVSWSSRLQPTVATSTAEAEYMASGAATKEALWYRHLARDLQMRVSSVPILCDSQAAIKIINNPISSARSKHIDVLHHFVRERVARGEIVFSYCKSADMVADCLTKPLPLPQFKKCIQAMGLR
uniref:Gag,protease,endonuclease, reverse transcriptase,RNaseH n=1 Tax=Volvox carteri TaxID=3067 RepID=Q06035_VOLCA|nr:gag,protease,endonuclease, reverse transcriptase,RNaseH [Volvox carteri f. nagariensis]